MSAAESMNHRFHPAGMTPPVRKSVPGLRWAGLPGLLIGFLVAAAAPAWGVTETDVSRPGAGGPATPVQVNLYLADLQDVSGADQTFLADLIVLAAWRDPRLAGKWDSVTSVDLDAVWNPRLQVVNQRAVSAALPQRVEVDPSGQVLYRQRLSGRFTTRMDLRDFPMDRQKFRIQLVCLGYPRSEVELTPFPEGRRAGRAEEFSVTDWAMGRTQMEAADFAPAPGMTPIAGVQLTWDGRRYVGYYVVQVILPLVMIVLMGWAALWIDPGIVVTRMSIAVTTMLTLIAYRFALGRLVPSLAYLTRFDYFTLGSTLLVFLLLMYLVGGAYLVGKDRRPLVGQFDAWVRIVFPLLFAAVCLLLWLG
jgi:hypothetical protein